ncbi:hypothetical protein Q8W30_03070 [Neptunomonas phycophila]|uniref:YD repeat-containing protein n=1 Tax=Neptunomonas phycophila TaxID=1572645 RepID=A0ABT9ERK9_9GAMM|nr:hypothetical protein [Neptunomonas phycophila]MDP2521542.1 hypothetical protein [Neptunomonas phycophila]
MLLPFKRNATLTSVALASSLLLTACGGGGGGGSSSSSSSTDTPDVPESGYRVSQVQLDYDNNGTPDATVAITYDSNGSIESENYTYTDDGTPDLFRFYNSAGDSSEAYSYEHLATGQLSNLHIESGTRQSFSQYTYNSSNQLSTVTETITNGTSVSEKRTTFTYSGGRLTGYNTVNTVDSSPISRGQFSYDGDGRIETQTQETWQAASSTWSTLTYTTSWTDEGYIEEVAVDTNDDGNADITLAYTYGSGGEVLSRVRTDFTNDTQDSTVTYRYSSNNIRNGEDWDLGSDGSIDATLSITVANEACQYSYGWNAGATANFGYEETTDYTPGSGAYRIRACITPGE